MYTDECSCVRSESVRFPPPFRPATGTKRWKESVASMFKFITIVEGLRQVRKSQALSNVVDDRGFRHQTKADTPVLTSTLAN